MNNLRKIDSYLDFGKMILLDRGMRLGDNLILSPFQGKRQEIVLNRTDYHLRSKNCPLTTGQSILLPGLQNQQLSFSMVLLRDEDDRDKEENFRYFLSSNNSTPFRINQTFVFQAFIERGDRIELGYNTLQLFPNDKEQTLLAIEEVAGIKEIMENKFFLESDITVLLEGDTGVGKTSLAKIIHEKSGRSGRFIHINLASFSPGLLESELFGHVKGAFTGAYSNKTGAFLEAQGGTLFLDEIDSINPELQTKLLLFLDDKKFRVVGGQGATATDARLIFASGKNIKKLNQEGKIRHDLYYRLKSGICLQLPPLKRRPQLIRKICEEISLREDFVISNRLVSFYQKMNWPGNIRQLKSHLLKKKILSKNRKLFFDEFDSSLLMENGLPINSNTLNDLMTLSSFKKNYALKIFEHFEGNLNISSKVLNISGSTLKSMLSA